MRVCFLLHSAGTQGDAFSQKCHRQPSHAIAYSDDAPPDIVDARHRMRMPARTEEQMPVLRLPMLTALRSQSVYSMRYLVTLTSELPSLQALELRRSSTFLCDQFECTDRHFVAVMGHSLAQLHAGTLRSLTLSSTYLALHRVHLASLTQLTHLSLTQGRDATGIPTALLGAIEHDLPQLRQFEVRLGDAMPQQYDREWWSALARIPALRLLSLACLDETLPHGARCCAGIAHVLAAPHVRLEHVELWADAIDLLRGYPHVHTVCIADHTLRYATIELLSTLPQLTSLSVAWTSPANCSNYTLTLLRRMLPRLRALDVTNRYRMSCTADALPRESIALMLHIESLGFIGYHGGLSDGTVDAMCTQLALAASFDVAVQEQALRVFRGQPRGAQLEPPACRLRKLSLSGCMITHDQCARLLAAAPQLTIVISQSSCSQPGLAIPSDKATPRLVCGETTLAKRFMLQYDKLWHLL